MDNLNELILKAEAGDAQAQCNLALSYKSGLGVEQDYTKAVFWYTKAALAGHAQAQCNLGYCYDKGEGIEQDCTKAVFWYTKAAQLGNIQAQYNLGLSYDNGEGIEQDCTKAVFWYTKAAEAEHEEAQCSLGYCYESGLGVEQDYSKAVYWYTKAALAGHAQAQYNLAISYESGLGVEQDCTKAVFWYTKAAEAGYEEAQNNLGICYESGLGVEQDYSKAVYWYTKAALAGEPMSQNNLGRCYSNGLGVEQDYSKAVYWYTKSAETNNADAQCNLGYCYSYGYGVPKDNKKAIEWYKKAAKQRNSSAQYSLGAFCEEALIAVDTSDGNTSLKEALSWYYKAAVNGDPDAEKAIEKVRQKIINQSKNSLEAKYFGFNPVSSYTRFDAKSLFVKKLTSYLKELDFGHDLQYHQKRNTPLDKTMAAVLRFNSPEASANEDNAAQVSEFDKKLKEFESTLKEIAERGFSKAEFLLGVLYCLYGLSLGLGDSMWQRAFEQLKRAADQDEPDAQYYVSRMLENGLGCNTDKTLALEYCYLAAKNNQEDAMVDMYCRPESDRQRAEELYILKNEEKILKSNDIQAIFKIGKKYFDNRQYDEAYRFLIKAKSLNNVEAACLITAIHKAKGDEYSMLKALYDCAKMGHTASQFEIGLMVATDKPIASQSVTTTTKKVIAEDAFYWFSLAAESGFVPAIIERSRILQKKQSADEAIKYLTKVNMDSGDIYFRLGELFEETKQYESAYQSFVSAKKGGYAKAASAIERYNQNQCPHCRKFFTFLDKKTLFGTKTVCSDCGKKIK